MGLLNFLKGKQANQEQQEQKYSENLTSSKTLKKLIDFLSPDMCQTLFHMDQLPSRKKQKDAIFSSLDSISVEDRVAALSAVQTYADYVKSPMFKEDITRASLLQGHLKDIEKLINHPVMDSKKDGLMMVEAEKALTAETTQMLIGLKDAILPKDATDRLKYLHNAQTLAFAFVMDATNRLPAEKRMSIHQILYKKGKQVQTKPLQRSGESR